MAKKPVTTRSGRFFKLAGMTASVAGQFAGQKARSFFSSENDEGARSESYSRMASRITDTLGEMKGAAMKVGQIASQTQDFLPREFSDALQKLQKEAPPMPFEVIRQQIETALGKPVHELYEYLQEAPYAAASIGQVHRARMHDGTDVIVKVQYPGVDESCDSDLKQLRLALKLGGLLKMPKESVDQLFGEIRERVLHVAFVRLPERVEESAGVGDRPTGHVDANSGDHPQQRRIGDAQVCRFSDDVQRETGTDQITGDREETENRVDADVDVRPRNRDALVECVRDRLHPTERGRVDAGR
jgi:hypothetical protein